jgi:hypothetical protein
VQRSAIKVMVLPRILRSTASASNRALLVSSLPARPLQWVLRPLLRRASRALLPQLRLLVSFELYPLDPTSAEIDIV